MRSAVAFLLAPVVALVVTVAACDGGGDYPPTSNCASSADCPSTMVCEFLATAGCGAQGECAVAPSTPCEQVPVCSCAGVTATACIADGYAQGSPVKGTGACGSGSALDAGGDGA